MSNFSLQYWYNIGISSVRKVMRRKLNIIMRILFIKQQIFRTPITIVVSKTEENLCLDLTKERVETPQCKNLRGPFGNFSLK